MEQRTNKVLGIDCMFRTLFEGSLHKRRLLRAESRLRSNKPETNAVMRKTRKRNGIQISKYRANISSRSGFNRFVYTDVYVSRYWTKVAPSVLDATRSDLSVGTDFSVREGETTRRAIFLRLQLDNVPLSHSLSLFLFPCFTCSPLTLCFSFYHILFFFFFFFSLTAKCINSVRRSPNGEPVVSIPSIRLRTVNILWMISML